MQSNICTTKGTESFESFEAKSRHCFDRRQTRFFYLCTVFVVEKKQIPRGYEKPQHIRKDQDSNFVLGLDVDTVVETKEETDPYLKYNLGIWKPTDMVNIQVCGEKFMTSVATIQSVGKPWFFFFSVFFFC